MQQTMSIYLVGNSGFPCITVWRQYSTENKMMHRFEMPWSSLEFLKEDSLGTEVILLLRCLESAPTMFIHPPHHWLVPWEYCFLVGNARINCDIKSGFMNYSEGFTVKFLCEKYVSNFPDSERSPGDVSRSYFDNSFSLQMMIAQFQLLCSVASENSSLVIKEQFSDNFHCRRESDYWR